MKVSHLALTSILVLVSTLFVSAQEYTYPNELKGFELFKKGDWKSLKPLISTKEDVIKIFGQDCSESCDYDENWQFQVIYIEQCSSYSESKKKWIPRVAEEMLGKYEEIRFSPKKRIKKSNLKFGKKFRGSQVKTSSSILMINYTDAYGLVYTFSRENTFDRQYRKGDLLSISYSWLSSDYEKYKSKIDCESNS